MQDINAVVIIGRLTKDAEIKTLPSGTTVAEFSIANNWSRKQGDQWKDEVSYFQVVKFSPGGLAKYLVKGKQVGIAGELQQQWWEKDGQKQSRVKIIAQKLQLLGGKGGEQDSQAPYGTQPGDVGYSGNSGSDEFEDDLF